MTTLPEEAMKAAANAAHEELLSMAKQMNVPMEYTQSISVNNYRVMRAAITAAAPHLAAVRVKAEPWGWIIPRGGSKKPVILEASKFDQASAAAEADIHDLGYFPVYIHSAPASSGDIDPARTEGFRQGIDAAAKLADYFEETIYSEGMSEDVYYGISCTVSQIAREIRALSSPNHADAGKVEGGGWKQYPAAWMVRENDHDAWDFCRLKKAADDLTARGFEVVPLYVLPTPSSSGVSE